MSAGNPLLKLLADGQFHSGTALGRDLGITRAAICKQVAQLNEAGLDIHSVPGRGYRLEVPIEPLDRRRILKQLGDSAGVLRDRLTVLDAVDSTNRYLLAEAAAGVPTFHGAVCLAERQVSGRGRRGRSWVTTPYHNVMLSLGWRFELAPAALAGLSLACGLAVLDALEAYGVRGIALKWPNDILREGHKLAGLLIDLQGEASGPSLVVLGVGVNGYLAPREAALIDQPWTDLQTITGQPVARNRLAALLIRELRAACERFGARGFGAFRSHYERRHAFHGKPVRLLTDERVYNGVVEGVDERGALLVRDGAGKLHTYYSGDVSLRTA